MSIVLGKGAWKVGIGILGGLCLAVGIAAAAGSSRAGTAATFKVDHQLCYTGAGKFQPPPGKVRLIDQFSPNGYVPIIRPALALHCNPVIKIVKDPATGKQQVFKPTNPRAHLACLPFTLPAGTTIPTPKVLVTNQFGSATLYLKQPNLLCLPSWTSVTGPPNLKPTTPPGLNHFSCYPVGDMTGSYKIPPVVLLKDQFAAAPVSVQLIPLPQELCLPAKKIVTTAAGGTRVYPMVDPKTHLLCFGGVKTPTKPKVWDENQFGTSVVPIRAAKWLCLPSTKQIIPAG
jgi:hypothetical protein